MATELSNIYRGDASDSSPLTERAGTLRIYTAGKHFADGQLSLEIASSDNDGFGVAFRLTDAEEHYLFAMDAQRSFRVLAGKRGNVYRVLAHNDRGYQANRWYQLRIVLDGPRITVFVDGEKDLEAVDGTLPRGTFALYSWGSTGAKFRNLRWQE